MKIIKLLIYIRNISFSVLITGCTSGQNANNSDLDTTSLIKGQPVISTDNKSNINISLLLDLSDRIDSSLYPNPSMEYYKRDLGYITSVANAFEFHVKKKKIRT